jgi:hypothetical protein
MVDPIAYCSTNIISLLLDAHAGILATGMPPPYDVRWGMWAYFQEMYCYQIELYQTNIP